MTRNALIASLLLLPSLAQAGGHAGRATVSVHSGGSAAPLRSGALGRSTFSSSAVSTASVTSSDFGSTGFSGPRFSSAGYGGYGYSSPTFNEMSSLRGASWLDALRSAARLDPRLLSTPAQAQVVAAPSCCMECAGRAAPAAAAPEEPARRAGKPVIIEVAPSEELPEVWVVKGPDDIGHRSTVR